jgi:hypothetical protein
MVVSCDALAKKAILPARSRFLNNPYAPDPVIRASKLFVPG